MLFLDVNDLPTTTTTATVMDPAHRLRVSKHHGFRFETVTLAAIIHLDCKLRATRSDGLRLVKDNVHNYSLEQSCYWCTPASWVQLEDDKCRKYQELWYSPSWKLPEQNSSLLIIFIEVHNHIARFIEFGLPETMCSVHPYQPTQRHQNQPGKNWCCSKGLLTDPKACC